MNNVSGSKSFRRSVSWIPRAASHVVVLLIGFLLGWEHMQVQSRDRARSLVEATSRASAARRRNALASTTSARRLGLSRRQDILASGAMDAQRGAYELTRQVASSFFSSLRAQASREADPGLSRAQVGVEPVFAGRGESSALLARNDPAGTERLSGVGRVGS